jgi:hypothetical protein
MQWQFHLETAQHCILSQHTPCLSNGPTEVRSGDHGGHSTGPHILIHCSGNCSSSHSCILNMIPELQDTLYLHFWERAWRFPNLFTVKVRFYSNSSIGKVALAAYFHRAHYNSPTALAAYFCRYPATRDISRAVPKVSESSTGGAACTDQLTRRPRLVFSRQPLWCVAG